MFYLDANYRLVAYYMILYTRHTPILLPHTPICMYATFETGVVNR